MIEINYTLAIQMVNFLVLMFVLNAVLYRPIRNIIQERREKFAGYESDIGDLTARAEDRIKEIDDKLAEAKRDGFLKKDELKNQGLEEEKNILEAASKAAEEEIGKVKTQIATEIGSAREALKADVDAFSRELAQKVLGRSLS